MTELASPSARQYDVATMSERLAEAVRRVLDRVPGSDRELARQAGVPPSTVSRIRSGERGCTPAVAEALADVVDQWADDCRKGESILRDALHDEEESP